MNGMVTEQYLRDLKDLNELKNLAGRRFLISISPSSKYEEYKISEFSPSGKHVQLKHYGGSVQWLKTIDVYIVEELTQ